MILMAANPVLSPMTYPISAYVSELHQLLSSHRLMTDPGFILCFIYYRKIKSYDPMGPTSHNLVKIALTNSFVVIHSLYTLLR